MLGNLLENRSPKRFEDKSCSLGEVMIICVYFLFASSTFLFKKKLKEIILLCIKMASSKDILICSKCNWPKHEATDEHIAQYYGYNRWASLIKLVKKVQATSS